MVKPQFHCEVTLTFTDDSVEEYQLLATDHGIYVFTGTPDCWKAQFIKNNRETWIKVYNKIMRCMRNFQGTPLDPFTIPGVREEFPHPLRVFFENAK